MHPPVTLSVLFPMTASSGGPECSQLEPGNNYVDPSNSILRHLSNKYWNSVIFHRWKQQRRLTLRSCASATGPSEWRAMPPAQSTTTNHPKLVHPLTIRRFIPETATTLANFGFRKTPFVAAHSLAIDRPRRANGTLSPRQPDPVRAATLELRHTCRSDRPFVRSRPPQQHPGSDLSQLYRFFGAGW